jgi:GNAT superfamily N-acetyltransferase
MTGKSMNDLLKEATHLASSAFINTLSYQEIFRVEIVEDRFRHLSYLYYRNFTLISWVCPEGIHAFYDKNGSLEVFFMLLPSTIQISLWQKLQAGLLMVAFNSGWDAFTRLLKVADYFEEKEKEIMKDRPYLSLQRMVVHPDKQGQGLGTKHLGRILKEVADKRNLPVVLGTQDLKNVRFYEKL